MKINTTLVRREAQADLRANIRTMLADRGMTQVALCRLSGVSHNHLTTGLHGATWITVDAVEAFADVLEVGPEELLGDSIYKHERQRYDEFHKAALVKLGKIAPDRPGMPAEDVTKGRRRALCCSCGTLRTVMSWSATTEDYETFTVWNSTEVHHPDGFRRVVADLDCRTCVQVTPHAVLLDGASNRDRAETANGPSPTALARKELHDEIWRLSNFGVEFAWVTLNDDDDRGNHRGGIPVATHWDKAQSHWRIELDPLAPPRVVLQALSVAWEAIATGSRDCDGFGWWGHDEEATRAWTASAHDLAEEIHRSAPIVKQDIARDAAHRAFRLDEEGKR